MSILAGIVLYNPEKGRLTENIEAILDQVDHLVLINNGGGGDFDGYRSDDRITYIDNNNNLGIATALNQILQYALDHDYEWAITLDQDSVAPSDIIAVYRDIIKDHDEIGMICPHITDRNANLKREHAKVQDHYVEMCITSASMLRVKAWQQIGGFDDAMFIDSVDFDICKRLSAAGWKIWKTYKTSLLHEVGHSQVVKILGKEYRALNHSSFRYYHIVRNNVYMGRKFKCLLLHLRIISRYFVTVAFFENGKMEKLKCMARGLRDGLKMEITKHKNRDKSVNGYY